MRAVAVFISLAAAVPGVSLAQEEGLRFLPSLGEDDGLDRGVGGQRPGEDAHGEGADGPAEPGVAGTADIVPVGAEDPAAAAGGEERTALQPAWSAPDDAGLSGGVPDGRGPPQVAGSSTLLGYLEDRPGTPPAAAAGPGGAGAALFGCPRSVLEDLLKAATAKADLVSSLEIEREVLTLCGERQRLVAEILQAEAELERLWRESTGPAPAEVRPAPADVLAQLTEFVGAEVVEFVEEPVAVAPEPEPEPVPPYGWFSIFGTAGDLQAGVSEGGRTWFVREGDELPGGVVVDWIGVSPPGVHVVVRGIVAALPWRPGGGERG